MIPRFLFPLSSTLRGQRIAVSWLRSGGHRFFSDKLFDGTIPMNKVLISHVPSTVNGGINASEATRPTCAEVKFKIDQCDWINSPVRETFFEKYKHRIDKDGYFVVRSERTASGSLNVADCMDKLRFSIREVADAQSGKMKTVKEEVEERNKGQEAIAKKLLQVKRAAL